MSSQTTNVGLIVAGVLLMLVSAAADRFGLGVSPGLGGLQIGGMIVGVALAAVGLLRQRSGRS